MIAFLKGAVLALTMSLGMGPGLVVQFEASVNRGFRGGALVIAGLYSGDLILLGIGYLGVSRFISLPDADNFYLHLLGGLVLFFLGLTVLKQSRQGREFLVVNRIPSNKTGMLGYYLKGFIINISNPFIIFFWVGIIGLGGSQFGLFTAPFYIFFAGLLFTAITFDLLKCYIFSRLQQMFKPINLLWINRSLAFLLMIMGIGLFVKRFL